MINEGGLFWSAVAKIPVSLPLKDKMLGKVWHNITMIQAASVYLLHFSF